ncbi:MAG: hypothetical protein AAFW89_10815 [Bacteroidota bacterium]
MYSRFLFILLLCVMAGIELRAQVSSMYQIAARRVQLQQYEEAKAILQNLVEQEPSELIYVDLLIDCHIQLKEYTEAKELAEQQIRNQQNIPLITIRLAELYHYQQDTTAAFRLWEENLEMYPDQLQVYINTARQMLEVRAYLKAVDVYKLARVRFNNNQLFFSDVANAYMQSGEYELGLREWIKLIQINPRQLSLIQRNLLRYNDPLLNDITIVEVDEILDTLAIQNKAYRALYQLQIWLLQENKLYRRALVTARAYERKTQDYTFSLFNLGRQLVDNNEFELSIQAFNWYKEEAIGEIRWRAMEELGTAYMRWADYVDQYGLNRVMTDSLYSEAAEEFEAIVTETSRYSRIANVYLKQAELALDHQFNQSTLTEVISQLKSLSNGDNTAEIDYLEGRRYLTNKDFVQARLLFTRSNKKASIDELAEKTRYFLALTDFYAGDYEFAKIQLKTLGRKNTSYYANDALELRLWIMEGTAQDSTGSALGPLATAHFNYFNGNKGEANEQFLALLTEDPAYPFREDAFLFLAKDGQLGINQINAFVAQDDTSSLATTWTVPKMERRESIMWQRILAVEEAIRIGAEGFDTETLVRYLEDMILDYPQGFYAPYARKRLNELSVKQS